MDYNGMVAESRKLFEQAKAIYTNPESSQEDVNNANQMLADGKALQARAAKLMDLEKALDNVELKGGVSVPRTQFQTFGHYLYAVWDTNHPKSRSPIDPRLVDWKGDKDETPHPTKHTEGTRAEWEKDWEGKTLVEHTGATGGFLVPPEYLAQLFAIEWERNPIRARATVIPMRRRTLSMPALDQTGTAANQPHQYGGIVATWTEEATEKDETEPEFRQIMLCAHKLALYTECSDELLDDSAIGLAAYLTSNMGFVGAIRWEEEWCFLQGSGAGQPLGIVNAGATFVQPRAVAGTIGVGDIMNMVMHHHGDNPVWHITRAAMATLLQLNGPAANPTYIFIPNAREGMPATLMGFPIEWTEKLPAIGTSGDIALCDWTYYYIGDRQATTIDSTNIYRFRYDITSWRAVHRVDGRPALSQTITIADGTTQISPFVILGDVAT